MKNLEYYDEFAKFVVCLLHETNLDTALEYERHYLGTEVKRNFNEHGDFISNTIKPYITLAKVLKAIGKKILYNKNGRYFLLFDPSAECFVEIQVVDTDHGVVFSEPNYIGVGWRTINFENEESTHEHQDLETIKYLLKILKSKQKPKKN